MVPVSTGATSLPGSTKELKDAPQQQRCSAALHRPPKIELILKRTLWSDKLPALQLLEKNMIRILFILAALASVPASAEDWNEDQRSVWEALEAQIGHFSAAEYDKNETYIHPSLVLWMPEYPIPWRFGEFVMEQGPDLEYQLFPISVVVVGDTAIINAYWRRQRSDGEQLWRLHNTWVREDDKWRLLALYNTIN